MHTACLVEYYSLEPPITLYTGGGVINWWRRRVTIQNTTFFFLVLKQSNDMFCIETLNSMCLFGL